MKGREGSTVRMRKGPDAERNRTNLRLASDLAALVGNLDEDLCRRPSSGATRIVTLILFAGASSGVAPVLLSRESQIPIFVLYHFQF